MSYNPKPSPPRGIVCPKCKTHPKLNVHHSRPSGPGIKTRYVRCPECGFEAKTVERLVSLVAAK